MVFDKSEMRVTEWEKGRQTRAMVRGGCEMCEGSNARREERAVDSDITE